MSAANLKRAPGILIPAAFVALAIYLLAAIAANTANAASAWAAPSTDLPLPGPSYPAFVSSLTLRRNQPDPRFKGELVDVISVTVRNNGDTRQVFFTFNKYYGPRQFDASLAIVRATPDLTTLGDKTDITWWLPLARHRTRTIRFYVRSTHDHGMYCIGNTEPAQAFCVS